MYCNEKNNTLNSEIEGKVLLNWTGNPWKARPQKLTLLLLLFMLLHLFLIWSVPELGFFLVIFPLLEIGSAIEHLIPSKYTMTTKGIYQKNAGTQLFRPWNDVKSYIFEKEMGELFFVIRTFRSRFQRNMPIYYCDNQEMIKELVIEQIKLSKCENSLEEE